MYIDVISRLRDAVRRKTPPKWRTNSWFVIHGNAPAHRSVFLDTILAKNNVTHSTASSQVFSWSSSSWYTCYTCPLDWNQHWRNGASVMLLTSLRMRQMSWKGFHKTASSNVSKALLWLFLKKLASMILLFCISQKYSDSGNILNYSVLRKPIRPETNESRKIEFSEIFSGIIFRITSVMFWIPR
jgi:hypothetical protein